MKQCWETYVGITFYRLILVDFFFLLLSTFFGEFVRRLVKLQFNSLPGQNLSRTYYILSFFLFVVSLQNILDGVVRILAFQVLIFHVMCWIWYMRRHWHGMYYIHL